MKLWCFIFDKNLRIRRLFLQLLIKLQNIKSFDMTSFLSIQDFLTMFLYDYSTNPANSITKLYLKFLFPLFWKEVDFEIWIIISRRMNISLLQEFITSYY